MDAEALDVLNDISDPVERTVRLRAAQANGYDRTQVEPFPAIPTACARHKGFEPAKEKAWSNPNLRVCRAFEYGAMAS